MSLRRTKEIDPPQWLEFKQRVEDNIEFICEHFNSRWLVSVCDTYADFGTDVERSNAMLIVLLANQEKLAYTLRLAKPGGKLADPIPHKGPLWNGMAGFSWKNPDMHRNLFRRLTKCMEQTPPLCAIFRTIVTRMVMEPSTTIGQLNEFNKRDLPREILRVVNDDNHPRN